MIHTNTCRCINCANARIRRRHADRERSILLESQKSIAERIVEGKR